MRKLKWRAGYRIVCIEFNRHYLHIENQAKGKTRPCNVKDVVHKPPVKSWKIYKSSSKSPHYPPKHSLK